jgi:hypothetical protein
LELLEVVLRDEVQRGGSPSASDAYVLRPEAFEPELFGRLHRRSQRLAGATSPPADGAGCRRDRESVAGRSRAERHDERNPHGCSGQVRRRMPGMRAACVPREVASEARREPTGASASNPAAAGAPMTPRSAGASKLGRDGRSDEAHAPLPVDIPGGLSSWCTLRRWRSVLRVYHVSADDAYSSGMRSCTVTSNVLRTTG